MQDMLELLELLEHPPAQLSPQQASTCRKGALLVIGAHIERGQQEWMCTLQYKQEHLWDFVAKVTQHRMAGPQLQSLHLAMKGQQEKVREPQSEQQAQEEERVAACLAAAQAVIMQQRAATNSNAYMASECPPSNLGPCAMPGGKGAPVKQFQSRALV